MALAPSSDNVLLGKGKLLFDRFNASGVKTGLFHLGNCQTFEISTEDDVLENQNFMIAAGGVYKSVTRSRTVNLNITGFEFSTQNVAVALMGDVTSITQTTGTVTQTLTTNLEKGKFYQTADREITVTSLVAGTNTLTATGTAADFQVYDSKAGIIQIYSTTTATNSSTLVVVYTKAGVTADAVAGAKASKIEGQLLFIPDPATGPKWEVKAWYVSFNPNGAVGFISEDFGTWQVTGKVLDDSVGAYGGSASYPYYQMIAR